MAKETWREVILKGPGPQNKKEAIALYVKGLPMGTADLVPGVSGGTVALSLESTTIYSKPFHRWINPFSRAFQTKL